MEAILPELTVGTGVILAGLAVLLLAIGGVLMGYLADQEKAGKRFFWMESSLPEPEPGIFLPKGTGVLHAA